MIATQNPIEQEGTYPLPEAQLDRFMFNIKVDYPTRGRGGTDPGLDHAQREARGPQGALRPGDPEPAKASSARWPVSEYIVEYVSTLVRATRPKDAAAPAFVKELVDWGAGPRAGQFLIHGGKAMAAMDGRFSVAIDDIRKVADAGAAAPGEHELPGPGRGDDDRGRGQPLAGPDPRTRDSQVSGVDTNKKRLATEFTEGTESA